MSLSLCQCDFANTPFSSLLLQQLRFAALSRFKALLFVLLIFFLNKSINDLWYAGWFCSVERVVGGTALRSVFSI
jgi:hypothetical protein